MWVTFNLLCASAVTIIGPEYRGVLLEARREGFSDAYGSWTQPPPDTKFLQVPLTYKPKLITVNTALNCSRLLLLTL